MNTDLKFHTLADTYEPSPEEVAEWDEIEKKMSACKSDHVSIDEDGCLDCGYYSK